MDWDIQSFILEYANSRLPEICTSGNHYNISFQISASGSWLPNDTLRNEVYGLLTSGTSTLTPLEGVTYPSLKILCDSLADEYQPEFFHFTGEGQF